MINIGKVWFDSEKEIPMELENITPNEQKEETREKKMAGKRKTSNHSEPRKFEDIFSDIRQMDQKNLISIERHAALFCELLLVKALSAEQADEFLAVAKQHLQEDWLPFLTKVSLELEPHKWGNHHTLSTCVMLACTDVLNDRNIDSEKLVECSEAFLKTKDSQHIRDFLTTASSINTENIEVRRITPQELACITFICFSLDCKGQSPQDHQTQLIIDRTIAEFFSKVPAKNLAGKTLGSILTAKAFPVKRISELTFLYEGMADSLHNQSERIDYLEAARIKLLEEQAHLRAELERQKDAHRDLTEQIEQLSQENIQLKQNNISAENMMEFERNKYERQMMLKEQGIARHLSKKLNLELQSIRESIKYIGEDDRLRIARRLDRIDKILQGLGGKPDA